MTIRVKRTGVVTEQAALKNPHRHLEAGEMALALSQSNQRLASCAIPQFNWQPPLLVCQLKQAFNRKAVTGVQFEAQVGTRHEPVELFLKLGRHAFKRGGEAGVHTPIGPDKLARKRRQGAATASRCLDKRAPQLLFGCTQYTPPMAVRHLRQTTRLRN